VLIKSYPQVKSSGKNAIKFSDGTTMTVDDEATFATAEERLDHADLVDQLATPYPPGCPAAVPAKDVDPGRLRFNPFFAKLYGENEKEVSAHIRRVAWFGSSLQVTTINGVDKKLEAVAKELGANKEWTKYVQSPGGGFVWRNIAKTTRRSVHSYGIAVDINVGFSDYWLNGGTYRNRIPCEIGAVFEKHGFVWGAKWNHFDTMHFEYRPELLL
jgi:D-alanyl-D-alanine carboxypeptidase